MYRHWRRLAALPLTLLMLLAGVSSATAYTSYSGQWAGFEYRSGGGVDYYIPVCFDNQPYFGSSNDGWQMSTNTYTKLLNSAMQDWNQYSSDDELEFFRSNATCSWLRNSDQSHVEIRVEYDIGSSLARTARLEVPDYNVHYWWDQHDWGNDWIVYGGAENGGPIIFIEQSQIWRWHWSTSSPPYDKYDALSILRHELGHAMGLGHTTGGLMREYFNLGERYSVNGDPRDGMEWMY